MFHASTLSWDYWILASYNFCLVMFFLAAILLGLVDLPTSSGRVLRIQGAGKNRSLDVNLSRFCCWRTGFVVLVSPLL